MNKTSNLAIINLAFMNLFSLIEKKTFFNKIKSYAFL